MRRAGSRGRCAAVTVAVLAALAGCDGAATALHTGSPLRYLVGIDQLVAPNFTASSTAALVDASVLAGGDSATATALRHDGLRSAASVEYQRAEDFATANGPLDVVATVEQFSGIPGASAAYLAAVQQLDARPGAIPTSTGPLGDDAHAISIVRATSGGLSAVEITIEWRVANLVNIIVARGRYGGTRLDDVLVLASKQTANESGTP